MSETLGDKIKNGSYLWVLLTLTAAALINDIGLQIPNLGLILGPTIVLFGLDIIGIVVYLSTKQVGRFGGRKTRNFFIYFFLVMLSLTLVLRLAPFWLNANFIDDYRLWRDASESSELRREITLDIPGLIDDSRQYSSVLLTSIDCNGQTLSVCEFSGHHLPSAETNEFYYAIGSKTEEEQDANFAVRIESLGPEWQLIREVGRVERGNHRTHVGYFDLPDSFDFALGSRFFEMQDEDKNSLLIDCRRSRNLPQTINIELGCDSETAPIIYSLKRKESRWAPFLAKLMRLPLYSAASFHRMEQSTEPYSPRAIDAISYFGKQRTLELPSNIYCYSVSPYDSDLYLILYDD